MNFHLNYLDLANSVEGMKFSHFEIHLKNQTTSNGEIIKSKLIDIEKHI